jgi:CxxC motif-containing protein (DUF1111 family)
LTGQIAITDWKLALVMSGLFLAVSACATGTSELMQPDSGGEGTTDASNVNAFDNSARNLTDEDRRRFEVGDSFFTQNWVTAPASTDKRDGLGPLLNAQSCSSCHLRDGRGDPDGTEPGLLFRLSVPAGEGTAPEPNYGDQFQDRSILGVPAEGTVRTIYVEEPGAYDDGTGYTLRRPVTEFEDLAYGEMSIDVQVSPRLATPVFGVGLIEAIPEDDIVAGADADDEDGDGISGRPNYVTDAITGTLALGRFGWKANVPTVEQQVAHAFLGDIGITSPIMTEENCSQSQTGCSAAANGGSPEIEQKLFDDVVFYNSTLAVPVRRGLDDPNVEEGAGLFLDLGCQSCHTPSHKTGRHEIEALSGQVIFPFTDLLLHDMGAGLADGRDDGQANGSEWRTPPLWGLGLTDIVNGHNFFLHDGRARDLNEAILWHGGEAAGSAERFKALDAEQRAALLEFLDSL